MLLQGLQVYFISLLALLLRSSCFGTELCFGVTVAFREFGEGILIPAN